LRVKDGGDIDEGCTGKNAWDDVVRSLVPWILDISVIEWEAQKSAAVEKLRNALDIDFEYVPHTLSQCGFRNAIKRFMKTERSRLKARYMEEIQRALYILTQLSGKNCKNTGEVAYSERRPRKWRLQGDK
jgi:hypothetical protein